MNDEVFRSATESVCPVCLRTINASRFTRGNEVILGKECPEHGPFQTVIWRGSPSFSNWQRPKTPSHPVFPFSNIKEGCPRDCGLCPEHRQHTCTALIEVTQRCDLKCAYCFADGGNGHSRDPGMDAVRSSYERLLAAGGPYNVQLSGGEPTLREDLPEIAELGRSLGFHFIQVNTNGLRLARESVYAKELKDAGVASVFLQFDGLQDSVYERLRGRPLLREKMLAVEHCVRHGLGVVLVPTLVRGVNDHQIGDIIRFGLQHVPMVRGVHFQPVSYFGRYPTPPADEARMTIPEILGEIQAQTDGTVQVEHFKPPGCENAFCSFHGNFVLLENGELRAWTRHSADRVCCERESAEGGAAKAREFVSRFWAFPKKEETGCCSRIADVGLRMSDAPSKAEGASCCTGSAGPSLGGWDRFLERARTHSFCISGMAFQDAWNLDIERLKDCCIHVVHPGGGIIPFCAYNLTDTQGRSLYRTKAEFACKSS